MATIQTLQRKSGQRYRVLIRRQGHKTVTKVFDKKKAADAWALQMEGDFNNIDDFPDADARRHTVRDAIEGFKEEYVGKDKVILGRLGWWAANYGDRTLARFTQSVFREALKHVGREHAKASAGSTGKTRSLGRRKSPATVNRYHVAISIVMQWAIDQKWITRNPARGVRRLKEPDGVVRWLEDAEREALLTACDASTWTDLGLLVRLALSSGARLSELLKLTWRDIDLNRGLAYIADTKNAERRALPLVKPVRDLLAIKPRVLRSELLFPAVRDTSKPFAFRDHWYTAVRAASLEDFRFHDLRHSCASYLAMAGASHVQIADVLGHKTLAMVQRYSHLNTAHKQELLERVTGPMVSNKGGA